MNEDFDQTVPESWQQPSPQIPPKRKPSVWVPMMAFSAGVIVVSLLAIFAFYAFNLFRTTGSREKLKAVEYSYGKNGTTTMILRDFTVGTNNNDAIGDRVQMQLRRFEYSFDRSAGYNVIINVRGADPINVESGRTVAIEVDGKAFFATNELSGSAMTNSLGKAWESLFLEYQPEAIHALASCSSVTLRFDGSIRQLEIPLTPQNVQQLRVFAEPSKRDDARIYKPIK